MAECFLWHSGDGKEPLPLGTDVLNGLLRHRTFNIETDLSGSYAHIFPKEGAH